MSIDAYLIGKDIDCLITDRYQFDVAEGYWFNY